VSCARFTVRPERAGDEADVFAVHERAFGRRAEAELVDALRAAGVVTVSLVAEADGRVVGHVLFSPVLVRDERGTWSAVGLGPLAVVPERQREGIGDALARAGLEACRARGDGVVFVLGHAAYYPRFGFRLAAPLGLRWEHGHDESFFVAEVLRDALGGRGGVVSYRPEFEAT
jgi:putative acetyltransferase